MRTQVLVIRSAAALLVLVAMPYHVRTTKAQGPGPGVSSSTSNRQGGYGNGGYGGYGGYGGNGGYGAYGYANPLTALGQFSAANSQATTSYQQAYSMYLGNSKKREQTYFEMRKMNTSFRAEMELQRPHATPEQLVGFNKSRLPATLSSAEWNPAEKVFHWPQVLAGEDFAADRRTMEELFSSRANDPYHTGLGSQNSRDIDHVLAAMNDRLRAKIDEISAGAYLSGSKFLKSLEFEGHTNASAPVAVAAAK